MRIAQIAPLFESVPPSLYGGTERIVSYLTEELVRLGHEVTLFASGDSTTRAQLMPCSPGALRLSGRTSEEVRFHRAMLDAAHAMRRNFDVFHLHIDDWHLRDPRFLHLPHLTTIHGRLDVTQRLDCFRPYRHELSLASISNAQRAPLADANWIGTVHHGLPRDLYEPCAEQGDYLVFLGRVSPEKRVDRAIEIAGRFGMKLKIAAKIDDNDRVYYQGLAKQFQKPWVDFVGEVDETQKIDLLRKAYALLFPIDWPEPFGLAMVESMSCGTPVIAWPHGSVPEIVSDGLTGYIVDSIDAAVRALSRIPSLDRRHVARVARERFGARRMALEYLHLYELCIARVRRPTSARSLGAGGVRHAGPR